MQKKLLALNLTVMMPFGPFLYPWHKQLGLKNNKILDSTLFLICLQVPICLNPEKKTSSDNAPFRAFFVPLAQNS
jgi:hypothetical protein